MRHVEHFLIDEASIERLYSLLSIIPAHVDFALDQDLIEVIESLKDIPVPPVLVKEILSQDRATKAFVAFMAKQHLEV